MISRGVITYKGMEQVEGNFLDEDGLVNIDVYKSHLKRKNTRDLDLRKQEERRRNTPIYKVRVPLIHGVAGDNSAVPDDQLPFATYCPLPGSQNTELEVGDIVYVSTVDLRFDDLVILGCSSGDQRRYSNSGIALDRVQQLVMEGGAPVRLSEDLVIGNPENKNPITFENLSVLQGFKIKLNEYIWPIENGGTGVSIRSVGGNKNKDDQKKARDNLGVTSTVVISQSNFDKLVDSKKLEHNTIYYIWDDGE